MKENNLAGIDNGFPDVNNQKDIRVLHEELNKVIFVGDKLAEAAHRIQSEYDGIHRLRKALSDWYKIRATEFGRGENKLEKPNVVKK
jgi:hypothetical protein